MAREGLTELVFGTSADSVWMENEDWPTRIEVANDLLGSSLAQSMLKTGFLKRRIHFDVENGCATYRRVAKNKRTSEWVLEMGVVY